MKTRFVIAVLGSLGAFAVLHAQLFTARDPGVRSGDEGTGAPLPDLTANEIACFEAGKEDFDEIEGVGDGLGPRFNLDSCGGCHSQPATGGTSPPVNPQVAVATAFGARNSVPSFITLDGPVREARFKYGRGRGRDGGVHSLFVISGRADGTGDAGECGIVQDDFETHLARNNVVFRIPTPVFGAGLIEQIPDSEILANVGRSGAAKRSLGVLGRPHRISGSPNNNGNDGTVSRFGWKAQNKSLMIFAGEAYNVEMGITNEVFQTERDETESCHYANVPNDVTDTDAVDMLDALDGVSRFALFMRFLGPPAPSSDTPGGPESIASGRQLFDAVGCGLCHTPTLQTGNSTVAALRYKPVNLFSDLLLHAMGPGLADDIVQGDAGPDEFRTAPLWGLGQRIFFLHDGRTTDLVEAISAHRSDGDSRFRPSEANAVIDRFNALSDEEKQDVLNFLRSL